ncbi:hypothetical protein Pmani_040050 [Petrolisthes manimaculis]|uniref:Uncharacterized protein n=1 Tax=Petrolisthes manimaculis TaxID=1843537 RepID=A0AAE1TIX5_9EUCA|nr:hypothetical protein Pmani_040050 [Petrolisthes manimaculis]
MQDREGGQKQDKTEGHTQEMSCQRRPSCVLRLLSLPATTQTSKPDVRCFTCVGVVGGGLGSGVLRVPSSISIYSCVTGITTCSVQMPKISYEHRLQTPWIMMLPDLT